MKPWVRMIKREVDVIIILLISSLFLIIGEVFSLLLWVVFFYVGCWLSKILFKEIKSKNYFQEFYFVFSLIGLFISVDNYFNFEVLYGFAGDDKYYFDGVKDLIGQGVLMYRDPSIFSYILATIAYPVSFLKEISLTDLVVFNWACAGLIANLINKVSVITLKKNIPFILFLLAFPLLHVMSDTLSRLYRDNIILVFLLIGTIGILRKSKSALFGSIIPVALFRFANMAYFAFLLAFEKVRIKKISRVLVLMAAIVFLTIKFIGPVAKFAILYGSQITNVGSAASFENIDPMEAYNIRMAGRASYGGEIGTRAYSELTIESFMLRAAIPILYPLSFDSPFGIMNHSIEGEKYGFYIFYMVSWLSNIARIFVLPLLVIGIVKSRNIKLNALIGTYLLFTILVLLISGQTRHTAGAFMLNAVIVNNGYQYIRKSRNYQFYYVLGVVAMSFFTIIYNL